jgi:hypothetical protein
MDPYVMLLDLGISFGQSFLEKLKTKAPADLLSAGKAFVDSVAAHRDDVISKANLEAARG